MDYLTTLDKQNDDYTTPSEVWEQIASYLPKGDDVVIWEPFYNSDSNSADTLRALTGCQVVYNDADFFQSVSGTHIVTNPPFSCKEDVFNRLAELAMPFIVVIPSHSLCTQYIRRHFKDKLQIIIPQRRLQFQRRDTDTGERVKPKRAPFDSVYVCYNMALPKDILWL